jgi:hypothetical protein
VRWNRKKSKWRVRIKANGKVECHFCNTFLKQLRGRILASLRRQR